MSGKEMNETVSHDTLENIYYSIQTARLFLEDITEVVIFCDTFRENKVRTIANELLGTKWKISVISFDRPDTHPNSTIEYQNSTIPDILASRKFQCFKELLEITLNP
jgi:hypothetical protein